jgi:hypothetical protein
MKALITTILCILIITTSFASNFEGIKIGTTGKSNIEAKYTATKATAAKVTITNQAGIVINTINVTLTKGDNNIALVDVTTLEEGTFTISLMENGNTTTTTFVNYKSEL